MLVNWEFGLFRVSKLILLPVKSSNFSFHLLQTSDKFPWSNFGDLCECNLSIYLVKECRRSEKQSTKFNKLDKKKQSSKLNEVRLTKLISFLLPCLKEIVFTYLVWGTKVGKWVKHVYTFKCFFIDLLGCYLQQRKIKRGLLGPYGIIGIVGNLLKILNQTLFSIWESRLLMLSLQLNENKYFHFLLILTQ